MDRKAAHEGAPGPDCSELVWPGSGPWPHARGPGFARGQTLGFRRHATDAASRHKEPGVWPLVLGVRCGSGYGPDPDNATRGPGRTKSQSAGTAARAAAERE